MRVMYDPQREKMVVGFKNGSPYLYDKVPPRMFGALVAAESVGEFFQSTIRPSYTGKLLSEGES